MKYLWLLLLLSCQAKTSNCREENQTWWMMSKMLLSKETTTLMIPYLDVCAQSSSEKRKVIAVSAQLDQFINTNDQLKLIAGQFMMGSEPANPEEKLVYLTKFHHLLINFNAVSAYISSGEKSENRQTMEEYYVYWIKYLDFFSWQPWTVKKILLTEIEKKSKTSSEMVAVLNDVFVCVKAFEHTQTVEDQEKILTKAFSQVEKNSNLLQKYFEFNQTQTLRQQKKAVSELLNSKDNLENTIKKVMEKNVND